MFQRHTGTYCSRFSGYLNWFKRNHFTHLEDGDSTCLRNVGSSIHSIVQKPKSRLS